MTRAALPFALVVGALAIAAAGACSESFPKPLPGEADAAAPRRACPSSGVSKGPWSLAMKKDGLTVRFEACRPNVDGTVRFAPEAGGAPRSATATESAFEITSNYGALDPTTPHDLPGTYYMREAKLDGLAAGTCYLYTLGADSALGGRFCTARERGAPIKFLAIGDTNPTVGPTTKILAHVLPEKPDFTLHGGDIQYYDSTLETWAAWFPKMDPMLRNGAFLPAIGNHELEKPDEYTAYTIRFFGGAGFDGTDGYYRFQSGGVWFFTVNTEQPIAPNSEQMLWLQQKLEDASKQPGYRFSIVWVHRPFVTCGDTDDNASARDALEPFLDRAKVPLVLQAHMHGYERFTFGSGATARTYVTAGGGGGVIQNVDKNASRAYCKDRVKSGPIYHGVLFDIAADTLRGRVVDETGAVRDDFSIPVP